MTAVTTTRLEILDRNLTRAFVRYHADAQIRRIAGVFFGTLAMQLALGFHDWTYKGLLSLGAAVAVGTLRKLFPTMSWKLVQNHVGVQLAQEAAAAPTPATAPASGPAADQVYTPVTQPVWPPPGPTAA